MAKPGLNECIANALIISSINPILITSFTDSKKGIISLNLALYLIPLLLKTLACEKLKEWIIIRLFSHKTLKNGFNINQSVNTLMISELIEFLGLSNKEKSPLEQLEKLKILMNNEKNDIEIIDNPIREIIFMFLKVFIRYL